MTKLTYINFKQCEVHENGVRCVDKGIWREFAKKVLCTKHYKEAQSKYFAAFFITGGATFIILGLIITYFL